MASTAVSCKLHPSKRCEPLTDWISANVLIIIIVSTFDLYFLRKNRLAKAGKILIDNEPGFLYTL